MPANVQAIPCSPRSGHFGDGASLCQMFYLGMQSAGDLRDYMANGTHAPKNTGGAGFGDAAAWANAGFLTTGGSVDEYCQRAAASGADFTLAEHAFILALRIKKATPGGNEIIASCYTSGSPGGWRLTANSTGSLALAINSVDNVSLNLTITSTYTPLDGNEHLCCWFVPPDAVNARFFVDGLSASSASAATVAGKNCAGGNAMRIGSDLTSTAAKVCQFGSLQQYNVPCATLASIPYDAIAQWMYRNPHRPVPDWMWGQ